MILKLQDAFSKLEQYNDPTHLWMHSCMGISRVYVLPSKCESGFFYILNSVFMVKVTFAQWQKWLEMSCNDIVLSAFQKRPLVSVP